MNIQYLLDSNGNKTAVVIPIQEWEMINEKYQDLNTVRNTNQQEKIIKPSDFAGKMSKEGYDAVKKHIAEARNEWDRNF